MSSGYFPFGQVPALSQPPVTYDIVMAKNFPRVSFVPTEPGGLYQELVEVNGDLWFVTNATWDVNKLGWYQASGTLVNCNASQNAYAWVQRGLAGDAIRMYGAATGNSTVAVSWVPVFDAAPVGTTISPLPLTQANHAALTVNATFNGSTSTPLTAFSINVQNVASAASSALVQYTVNNIPVWLVDINGVLQIGSINPSQLNPPVYMTLNAGVGIAPIGPPPSATIALAHGDYVDLATNQTITGTKTIANPTPLVFGGGGNISGGATDALYLCSGCEITVFGTGLTALAQSATCMILAGKQEFNAPDQMLTLYIDIGQTPGTTYNPTQAAFFTNAGTFHVVGDVTIGGTLSVTGGFTIAGPLTVNGTTTLNGNLVLSPTAVQGLINYFEGVQGSAFDYTSGGNGRGGLVISYDSANNAIELDTSRLMYIGGDNSHGITSADHSVTITKNMGTSQVVDLSVATAVAKALPVWYGGNQLTKPLVISGSGTVALTGAGGFNGFPAGNSVITFPSGVSFASGNYAVAVSVGGDWFISNTHSLTSGGFSISVSATGTGVGSALFNWVAIGQSS
jgi:hypothetical protein